MNLDDDKRNNTSEELTDEEIEQIIAKSKEAMLALRKIVEHFSLSQKQTSSEANNTKDEPENEETENNE